MVKVMVNQVSANHPDVAKQMEAMHNKEPSRRGKRDEA
jgi:hypothetical protein